MKRLLIVTKNKFRRFLQKKSALKVILINMWIYLRNSQIQNCNKIKIKQLRINRLKIRQKVRWRKKEKLGLIKIKEENTHIELITKIKIYYWYNPKLILNQVLVIKIWTQLTNLILHNHQITMIISTTIRSFTNSFYKMKIY
jgi:hypothetical protein